MEYIDIIKSLFDPQTWIGLREQMPYLGPIYGILLPVVEAFIPPLPLALFVTINVFMFGFVFGYLLSWIGTCIGSILVYFIFRKVGRNAFIKLEAKYDIIRYGAAWISNKGLRVLFIIICFPFTPSFIVCALAAFTGLKPRRFIPTLVLGKMVMVLFLSVIGANIFAALDHPVRLGIVLAVTVACYFTAKHIYDKIEKQNLR